MGLILHEESSRKIVYKKIVSDKFGIDLKM